MTSAQGKRVKKWVKALRSGQYRQTRGQLRKVGYCCLGVACQVYHEETGKGKWVKASEWRFRTPNGYPEGESSHLPYEVAKYFGVIDTVGSFTSPNGSPSSLATRNDSGRANFQKIADIIESKPRGLFR